MFLRIMHVYKSIGSSLKLKYEWLHIQRNHLTWEDKNVHFSGITIDTLFCPWLHVWYHKLFSFNLFIWLNDYNIIWNNRFLSQFQRLFYWFTYMCKPAYYLLLFIIIYIIIKSNHSKWYFPLNTFYHNH